MRALVTTPFGFLIGLALGALGSGGSILAVPVLVYATLAMAIWYYVIRPAAERDLAARFGESWHAYTRAVRGFRPRLTPYRPTINHS